MDLRERKGRFRGVRHVMGRTWRCRTCGGRAGWADSVAARLALAEHDPEFRYANLSMRGKLIGQIADERVRWPRRWTPRS